MKVEAQGYLSTPIIPFRLSGYIALPKRPASVDVWSYRLLLASEVLIVIEVILAAVA